MRDTVQRPLTPEEDAIDDLTGDDDEIDDTLPADLWFRKRSSLRERLRGWSIRGPRGMR